MTVVAGDGYSSSAHLRFLRGGRTLYGRTSIGPAIVPSFREKDVGVRLVLYASKPKRPDDDQRK